MRVRLKTRKRVPKSRKRRMKHMKSKKMRGGSAPMSEWGNVFSNLGYLSQSALNQFSVPIPTIAGQTSSSPFMTQQFPLIKPLLLD